MEGRNPSTKAGQEQFLMEHVARLGKSDTPYNDAENCVTDFTVRLLDCCCLVRVSVMSEHDCNSGRVEV